MIVAEKNNHIRNEITKTLYNILGGVILMEYEEFFLA